jgi:hypothetical protein
LQSSAIQKGLSLAEYQKCGICVPIVATWDNHDYGKHDGGATLALKDESKKLFLDFFEERDHSGRRRRSRPTISLT